MSKKLSFLAMVLIGILLSTNTAWGDSSYTITFANGASQATAISSTTNASTTIADDGSRSYVTTQPYTVSSGNCYYGDTQSCIRIGKSGTASSLSIALSTTGQVSATTIVVNCDNTGGNKNSSATLSVNGATAQTTKANDPDNYTFTINDDITEITLEGSASIRIYSITVNYSTGGGSGYTVNFAVADGQTGYGTVSSSSVTGVASGTAISASTNTVTIGTGGSATTVTATPADATDEYVYTFNSWSGIPAGGTVTGTTNVTASFTRTARCAAPTFSPTAGNFTSAQNITISCETAGATIYYTTNGTDPTTSSSVYSSAIPVNATTTIKAMATKASMANSAIASGTFTILDCDWYESFDNTSGTGGRDGVWSGSIGVSSVSSDQTGWTFSSVNCGAYKCVKLGTGSAAGSALTPSLTDLRGTLTLTFSAAGFGTDGTSDGNGHYTHDLTITATNGTVSPSSVTITNQTWDTYEVTISSVTANTQITIASSGSNKRFFLDDVCVKVSGSACTPPDHVNVTGRWDRFGGETISLTATAYDGSDNEITTGITGYQWQKLVNSTWTNVTGANVSGATSANLQITSCTKDNSGKYRCTVSTGNTCSTPSATATDGTQGFDVKVYTLDCYNGGTTSYNFTRVGDTDAGTVTVNLSASTSYEFEVVGDNDYYGNTGTINEDVTNWVMTSGAGHLHVNSGLGGTFTFTMDYGTGGNNSTRGVPELSVTYPRKTIYFSPGVWDSGNAKFAIYYFRKVGDVVYGDGFTDFISANDCGTSTTIPQWNGVSINAVRLNENTTASDLTNSTNHYAAAWAKKWNQTANITITSDNYISITGWGPDNGDSPYTYGTYATPTYTITYSKGSTTYTSGNAISGSHANDTKTCGSALTLPGAEFTTTGYTQDGWATSDGGSKDYNLGGSYATNAAQEFFPHWAVNSHTLSWVTDGDALTGSYTTGTVNYGAGITPPNTPTKTGFTFAGWSDGSSVVTPASTMPDNNVTYTATWTTNKYTVTWHVGENTTTTTNVEHGTAFHFLDPERDAPAHGDNALSECGSTKFIGWVKASGAYTGDGKTVDWYDTHKVATNFQITEDTHFYAMYAESSGGVTDVLNKDNVNTGSTGTTSWTDVEVTCASGAVYQIHTMGTSDEAIRWNSNGYLYCSTAPTNSPRLQSVTITTTADKNIGVYGSTTAYSAKATETSCGTLSATSSGGTYTFTLDYNYIGLNGTASSTYISSISISYGSLINYRTGCVVSCAKPTSLTNTSITKTGATIGWTGGGNGTLSKYEYAYWVDGDTEPTSGFVDNSTNTTATLTGLYSGLKYNWKVRKVCTGGDGDSRWAYSYFTTTAADLTYDVPTGVTAVTTPETTADNLNAADVPTDCGSCWAFVGWTTATYTENSAAPAVLFPAGTKARVSGDTKLYAVYGKEEYEWFNDISEFEPGKYVLSIITTDEPDNEYALKNVLSGINATSENINSYVQRSNYVYNPDPSFVWELSGSAGSWHLRNAAANKYLNLSSTSGNILTDGADNLTIAYDGSTFPDGFYTYHTGTEANSLVFADGNVWTVDEKVPADKVGYNYYYKRTGGTYTTSPNCPKYTVTWDINNGASTIAGSDVTACDGFVDALPTAPNNNTLDVNQGGCITNGKGKFIGWSPNKVMPAQDVMPEGLFTDVDGSPEITENTTFYAVFAEEVTGDAIATNTTYTFTSKSWADDTNSWTSSNDGYALNSERGIQVIKNGNAEGVTKNSYNAVTKVVVTYCTNASTGEGTIVVTVGDTEIGSSSATSSGGTTHRTLEFTHAAINGKVKVSASATESSLYIYSVQIFYTGSGVSYSGYRTACCNDAVFTFVDGDGDPLTTYTIVREDMANANDYGTWDDFETSSSNTTGAITWTSTLRQKSDNNSTYTWSSTNPQSSTGEFYVDMTEHQIKGKNSGVYVVTLSQAGANNYCDADAVVTVTVKTVDKFIDNVNGNFSGEAQRREDVGNGIILPTAAEFAIDDGCKSTERHLIGWIKASDLASYVSSGSTGYIDALKTSDPATNKVIAPGTKLKATGCTWYAVWGVEK